MFEYLVNCEGHYKVQLVCCDFVIIVIMMKVMMMITAGRNKGPFIGAFHRNLM